VKRRQSKHEITFTTARVFLLTTVKPESEAFTALTEAKKSDGTRDVEEFIVGCSVAGAEIFLASTQRRDCACRRQIPQQTSQWSREGLPDRVELKLAAIGFGPRSNSEYSARQASSTISTDTPPG
jgi:hypothetical protein